MTFDDHRVFHGQTVLEIGSGAGRYTDHLVDRAARVISVDPSAIGINVALGASNLIPVRGDLFDLPVRREKIDVVFCRGVVQHTGNTGRAIKRLFDYVKPGGTVLFDVYSLKWFTPFYAKYWIRPLTRHMSAERFIPFAQKWVPRLLTFKHKYVMPLLPKNKLGAKIAAQIVPIADFTGNPVLASELQIEWSVLDTVDMYTPLYDRPMTWRGVMRTLSHVGARDVRGDYSLFCFKATAPY
jgi:SAM-dependent methyltransferase